MAKTGIILSSVISGVLGYLWLRFVSGKPEKSEAPRASARGILAKASEG